MMINPESFLKALDVLRLAGVRQLRVTPDLYVGLARYMDRCIRDRHDLIGRDMEDFLVCSPMYATDDDIVDHKLGNFRYCGITFELHEEEYD